MPVTSLSFAFFFHYTSASPHACAILVGPSGGEHETRCRCDPTFLKKEKNGGNSRQRASKSCLEVTKAKDQKEREYIIHKHFNERLTEASMKKNADEEIEEEAR